MVKRKKILFLIVGAVLSAVCIFTLFLPFPKAVARAEENYRCVWEDGEETSESYASAFSMLQGIAEDGTIELKYGTHVGRITPGEDFYAYNDALSKGSLLDLLLLGNGELSRIERAALYEVYGGTAYYSADAFRYTGERVVRENFKHPEKVVLLSGTLGRSYLSQTGAKELRLASEAKFSADRLLGSRVEKITAAAPYCAENDLLYLDVAGQRRLLAAVPTARKLTVGDCDYADEGALAACTQLEDLTIPFAGNAKRNFGSRYDGTFAWLFSSDGFLVPKTLKTVRVLGGKLVSRCFYGCPYLQEVNACGLSAEDVSDDAFADMVGWKCVHSSNGNLILTGKYSRHIAPCGCTVFVRG